MFELAESLSEIGHDVTVISAIPRQRMGDKIIRSFYKKKFFMIEKMKKIVIFRPKILQLPLSNPITKGMDHFFVAISYLWAGLCIRAQDIIFVYSPPLTLGLTGILLSRKFRAPIIFNAQDIFPRYAVDTGVLKNRILIHLFTKIEEYIYRTVNLITVHSVGNQEHIVSRGFDRKKIKIIYNWVDTKCFLPGEKYNELRRELGYDKEFIVSYAGTIGWAQGLDSMLEAAEILKNKGEIKFIIVGDGPRRIELENHVREKKINNVLILKLLPRDKYRILIQASDACVISLNPKISTPVVPGKLFDIMACARPVIGSIPISSDAREIISRYGCGICVDPEKPDELAASILYLIRNPGEREKMGINGRKAAEKYFSRDLCTNHYERLIASMKKGSSDIFMGKEVR